VRGRAGQRRRPGGTGGEAGGQLRALRRGQRWHIERTNARPNALNRLQRCYERNENVIDAFFDLADVIITVRRLSREA
jgi:hypothetical protein